MTADLLVTLIGLALLDSLNTSTLFLMIVILLTARRAVPSGASYAIGAALAFFGLAIGLYFGASAAESAIADAARWIRRGTFALLALFLFYLAVKRLRDRARKPFTLPAWFSPSTALPLGAAATLADLPNAFPLFLAIERILTSEIASGGAVLVLAGYTVVYIVPTVLLILLWVLRGERIRARMQRIKDRVLGGVARRSIPTASLLAVAGMASAGIVAVV